MQFPSAKKKFGLEKIEKKLQKSVQKIKKKKQINKQHTLNAGRIEEAIAHIKS